MLQQILRTMHVDPEILQELDENQKQTLFCKMREEQVRRWKAWEESEPEKGEKRDGSEKTRQRKSVSFLRDANGEPWVWVMGEHEADKSIEEILREEAVEKARRLAEKETEELKKKMEAQLLSDYIDLTPKIGESAPVEELKSPMYDDGPIYCSVQDLQLPKLRPKLENYSFNGGKYVLQEISLNSHKVAQRIALWEKKTLDEKTCEIFKRMQMKKKEAEQRAEEEGRGEEELWRERERKAKQAEQQIREIARKAREEHRLSSCVDMKIDATYNETSLGVPPSRDAVIEWYRNKERPRSAGLDQANNVETWFHGLIPRAEAENLLNDRSPGTFLVRLSEKIWGYAISYRAKDKCKHYLVNSIPKYHFAGNKQVEHNTLGDLISYHQRIPLTDGDALMYPCPRRETANLDELFDRPV